MRGQRTLVQIDIPVYTRFGRPLEAARLLWALCDLIVQLDLEILPSPDGRYLPICIALEPCRQPDLNAELAVLGERLDVDEIRMTLYPNGYP